MLARLLVLVCLCALPAQAQDALAPLREAWLPQGAPEARTALAAGRLEEALAHARRDQDRLGEAYLSARLGLAAEQPERAAELLEAALAALGSDFPTVRLYLLQELSARQVLTGRLDRAEGSLRLALELAPPGAARGLVLKSLGNCLSDQGRTDDSEKAYREALEIFAGAGEAEQTGACRQNLALLDMERGRYPAACKELEEVRAEFLRLGLPLRAADVEANLGLAYARLGRAREAEAAYRSAVERLRELPDRAGVVWLNLANLYLTQRRLADSLVALGNAETCFRSVGARVRLAHVREARALVLFEQARMREAIPLLEEALSEFRALGLEERAAVVMGNLALSYVHLGQLEQAERSVRACQEI
ncbi:MAG: tetratricopeptide repeat protein, partial [Candidatus Eremiobacterota bacterium]